MSTLQGGTEPLRYAGVDNGNHSKPWEGCSRKQVLGLLGMPGKLHFQLHLLHGNPETVTSVVVVTTWQM